MTSSSGRRGTRRAELFTYSVSAPYPIAIAPIGSWSGGTPKAGRRAPDRIAQQSLQAVFGHRFSGDPPDHPAPPHHILKLHVPDRTALCAKDVSCTRDTR